MEIEIMKYKLCNKKFLIEYITCQILVWVETFYISNIIFLLDILHLKAMMNNFT